MPTQRQIPPCEFLGANGREPLAATDGEINFLWSFIQGSIMIPETRNALLRSYGFCERHAWIHIGVEMSFRDQYLLGSTILYGQLIEKSLRAISVPQRVGLHSVIRQLRATGRCLLCALNVEECVRRRYAAGGVGSRTR